MRWPQVASLAAAAVWACGDSAAVVVQVESTGLSVPDELDAFCLAAWDADIEGGEFARTYQFDGDVAELPQSLTIEPGRADAVELVARGYRDGIEVARARRVVEFSGVRDESLVLDRCAPGSAATPTVVGAATVPEGTRVAASFGRRGTLVATVGPMTSDVFRAYSDGIDTASVTAPPVSAGDPPLELLALDVDGDCDDDLVILPASAPPVLWRRGSEGSFSAVEGAFGATVGIHRAIAAADVDGDGDIDLAAGGAASLIILVNDGGGRFEVDPAPIPGDATTDVRALAFGDVDDDRDPDLVVGRGELAPQPVRVLRNTSGSFGPIAGALPETPVLARQVELFDADDDRRVDLLVAAQTSALALYGNAGAGVFADRSVAALPTQEVVDANAISAGDWDGDCLSDVVIGRPGGAPALLWRGSEGGMLQDEGFVRQASSGAWFADVDDDGARDLVIVDAAEGADVDASMIRGLAVAIAVAVAVAPVAPARADSDAREVARQIARGQKRFRELEYQEAIRTLAPIPHEPSATRRQKIDALELIGISHLILGDEAQARAAFEALLTLDPRHELRFDDGSPKIEGFYSKVRVAFVPGAADVQVEHSAPRNATAGSKIELEARILAGQDKAKELVVHWRLQGTQAYGAAPMRNRSGALWRASIDAPASPREYVVDYYIEVRGIAGNAIARVGGPEVPLGLSVATGRPARPWYARWYVIAGGAAVITLGTVLVLTASGDDGAESGSLDPGRVTLTP